MKSKAQLMAQVKAYTSADGDAERTALIFENHARNCGVEDQDMADEYVAMAQIAREVL